MRQPSPNLSSAGEGARLPRCGSLRSVRGARSFSLPDRHRGAASERLRRWVDVGAPARARGICCFSSSPPSCVKCTGWQGIYPVFQRIHVLQKDPCSARGVESLLEEFLRFLWVLVIRPVTRYSHIVSKPPDRWSFSIENLSGVEYI